MNNVWLDTFTSFPFDARGRILVMDHLLLSYLYLLLSLKMLVALWSFLKIICLLFGVVGSKRRNNL